MSLSNRWVVFFFILPHLSIIFFNIDTIEPVITVWKLGVILASIVCLFLIYGEITIFNVLLICHVALVLISSILNGTLSIGIFFTIIIFIGFCIYISYCMTNFKELISGLYYLFGFIIILNFITILTNGVSTSSNGVPIYLLGGKNAIVMTALPSIPIAYLYSNYIYKKLKIIPIIVILISMLSIYLSESGTGILVAILATIFLVLPARILPSFNTYLILYFIAFLLIVVFKIQILFGNFITIILDKDLTFTGRTYIWDFVLSTIRDSWLLGYGRGNSIISNYFVTLNETHNGVLEVLMFSGILGALVFLVLFLIIARKLSFYKSHIFSKVLSYSILLYMIIGLTESVFYKVEFWLLLIIASGIGRVIIQIENNAENSEIKISH
ncbi:O-antigen ligase family protein [Mangrovibacillus cuniculi]|uniref:O-antigen ligase family protein n=1 Tax=Mangrovibacillus cuniculi TaxID=2593652 RepID=A0A7S8HGK4_9BACI|nr:O-antigen ligase family protein [Mangrovibacillus cuniculi]QPC47646.1 O-antigen ligase family protein [Mangrovibacillus cuniculi]